MIYNLIYFTISFIYIVLAEKLFSLVICSNDSLQKLQISSVKTDKFDEVIYDYHFKITEK